MFATEVVMNLPDAVNLPWWGWAWSAAGGFYLLSAAAFRLVWRKPRHPDMRACAWLGGPLIIPAMAGWAVLSAISFGLLPPPWRFEMEQYGYDVPAVVVVPAVFCGVFFLILLIATIGAVLPP